MVSFGKAMVSEPCPVSQMLVLRHSSSFVSMAGVKGKDAVCMVRCSTGSSELTGMSVKKARLMVAATACGSAGTELAGGDNAGPPARGLSLAVVVEHEANPMITTVIAASTSA